MSDSSAPWRAHAHRRGLIALERAGISPGSTSSFLMGFYDGCHDLPGRLVAVADVFAAARGKVAGQADEEAWPPARRAKAGLPAIDYGAEPAVYMQDDALRATAAPKSEFQNRKSGIGIPKSDDLQPTMNAGQQIALFA